MTSPDLSTVLATAKTIAVVGCSPRETQTSHRIAVYLQKAGYTIVPVNPHRDEILGETAYPNVQSIPAEIQIDIVNVFRRSEHTEGVVHDVEARAEATGQHPLVWTQLGVHSAPAQASAEAAGLPYVAERCIMVDHRRLSR